MPEASDREEMEEKPLPYSIASTALKGQYCEGVRGLNLSVLRPSGFIRGRRRTRQNQIRQEPQGEHVPTEQATGFTETLHQCSK